MEPAPEAVEGVPAEPAPVVEAEAPAEDAPQSLATPEAHPASDLQRLTGQSAEMLSLYGQITTLVQQHLAQLAETADRLRVELDRETDRLGELRSERDALDRELDTLRTERDSLRQDLERMVENGLARRRELAAQIEQLERSRPQPSETHTPATRPWWRFW